MYIKKDDYYEIEEFQKLGVKAIYTTKDLGDSRDLRKSITYELEMIEKLGLEDKTIVYANQTHSTNIAILKDKIEDFYLDTDGFITKRKDLVLFTQYADCLPVYAYDTKNQVIGICHAGWKGAFNGIQKNMIKNMIDVYNSNPEDILIGLGIGISTDNYEVEADFFENYYKKYGKNIVKQVFSIKDNKYHYNNIEFNRVMLLEMGIKEENIVISDKCTYRDEFHSYRRDGQRSGRNGGYIFFE